MPAARRSKIVALALLAIVLGGMGITAYLGGGRRQLPGRFPVDVQRAGFGNISRQVLKPPIRPLPVTVPAAPDARLQLGFGVAGIFWRLGLEEVTFVVTFHDGNDRIELLRRRLDRATGVAFQEVEVPLGSLAGRSGALRLETELAEKDRAIEKDLIFWSPPVLHPMPPDERPNILLFSIDTLRPDHLGCYGYARDTSPALDRLAKEGVLFRQAIASSSWTLPSHASMLTGLDPKRHGAVRFDIGSRITPSVETVAERLWRAGYATGGFTDGGFVSAMFGFDRGFDVYVSGSATQSTLKNYLDENVEEARTWLRSAGEPFFLFLHTYAVHLPYAPAAPYDRMFDSTYAGPCRDSVDAGSLLTCLGTGAARPDVLEHVKALYDGEIRAMDAVFGRFLKQLEADGRLGRTCIIVTSDHGEEFMEHGHFFHSRADLYEELIRVPLIVWCGDRFRGGRSVDEQVALTDIAPTVLELAGVDAPGTLDGVSLLPALHGRGTRPRKPVLSEVDASIERRDDVTVAVRTERYKLITSRGWSAPLLFDLRDDPGETRSLGASLASVASQLQEPLADSSLSADATATQPAETTPAAAPDPAILERLRALGYIE